MQKALSKLSLEPEVDQSHKTLLQILNCVSYTFGCFTAYAAQALISPTLDEVSNEWALRILPAGWAFIIWAVIYTLLAVFTVYQALPDSCVPGRNNDLLFNKASYWVCVNFFLNGSWCLIFQQNDAAWFTIALVVCIGMVLTAAFVQKVSLEGRLTITELIGWRCGWTIYTGWLTVATTLNVGFCLKSYGLNETTMNIDESWWAVCTLIAAVCVYILISFLLKNPLYASVGIWVLFAIMDEQAAYDNVTTTCTVLLLVHGAYIITLTVYMILDKINNSPNEMYGLFY
jgi:translocator protein